MVAFFAAAAAVAIKAPAAFGLDLNEDTGFYLRNLSLFALPMLAGYLAWKRRLAPVFEGILLAAFAAAAVFANAYRFAEGGNTEVLTALHLPVVLWLITGIAYTGGEWRSSRRRMDYVRFTGEWLIYYAVIALGGGLLTAVTLGAFSAIGVDLGNFAESWLLPCGAVAAVVVAAWLVETRQVIAENLAPILTRLFTPLFAVMLLGFLVAVTLTGSGIDIDREVLIFFDVALIVILSLVVFNISARDPKAQPGVFDILGTLLVVGALAMNILVTTAILSRIVDFGLTANRVTALGENLILLVNFTWSAWLYGAFMCRRRAFSAIANWQTANLFVYAAWGAFVVMAIPPAFDFA